MNLNYHLGEKSGPVKTVPTGPAPTPMHNCVANVSGDIPINLNTKLNLFKQ